MVNANPTNEQDMKEYHSGPIKGSYQLYKLTDDNGGIIDGTTFNRTRIKMITKLPYKEAGGTAGNQEGIDAR
jgi:hypothetical protein